MECLDKLKHGIDLTYDEATRLFTHMISEAAEEKNAEQALILLAEKGETGQEIAACASVMRSRAVAFDHRCIRLLDTCGTGGDGSGSFNISTSAAIVCSLFLPVAKHGNRAVSSHSGSADFLEALNIPISLDNGDAARFLEDRNFVFLFAQRFHPIMKSVAPLRQRLKRRTIFNLLGPLLNPARPDSQLIGLFDVAFIRQYLEAVEILNIRNAMIVASRDGMDEVSLSSETVCFHKQGDSVREYRFNPARFGISADSHALKGFGPRQNAQILRQLLRGDHGDLRKAVAINAAFALVVSEVEENLEAAYTMATEAIISGKAYKKLEELAA